MFDVKRLIYRHGSENDSNSGKARQFREWFPDMLTPDFIGSSDERMSLLYSTLSDQTNWTLIGSSFGRLMGATFTHAHPAQVRMLISLARALTLGPSEPFDTSFGRRIAPETHSHSNSPCPREAGYRRPNQFIVGGRDAWSCQRDSRYCPAGVGT